MNAFIGPTSKIICCKHILAAALTLYVSSGQKEHRHHHFHRVATLSEQLKSSSKLLVT
jgi:hypothetical protein